MEQNKDIFDFPGALMRPIHRDGKKTFEVVIGSGYYHDGTYRFNLGDSGDRRWIQDMLDNQRHPYGSDEFDTFHEPYDSERRDLEAALNWWAANPMASHYDHKNPDAHLSDMFERIYQQAVVEKKKAQEGCDNLGVEFCVHMSGGLDWYETMLPENGGHHYCRPERKMKPIGAEKEEEFRKCLKWWADNQDAREYNPEPEPNSNFLQIAYRRMVLDGRPDARFNDDYGNHFGGILCGQSREMRRWIRETIRTNRNADRPKLRFKPLNATQKQEFLDCLDWWADNEGASSYKQSCFPYIHTRDGVEFYFLEDCEKQQHPWPADQRVGMIYYVEDENGNDSEDRIVWVRSEDHGDRLRRYWNGLDEWIDYYFQEWVGA